MFNDKFQNKVAESYNIQQQVQLRSLCCSDVPAIKQLCNQCFPIQYPDNWFEEIVSREHFHSIAATINHTIIAFIVCQVKHLTSCNVEDQGIVGRQHLEDTTAAYILSLGVLKTFRRYGIASLLLDTLLSHLRSDLSGINVVFLHVLTTNSVAISFYERRGFHQHTTLPFYYCIQGQLLDGFSYVLYINGGRAPCTLLECCSNLSRSLTTVCSLSSSAFSKLKAFSRRLVSHILAASLRLS